MRESTKLSVKCKKCGRDNVFNQPYAYHAGFGNQGFLYNDAGTLTLVWSSFDPAYEAIVGKKHPWGLTQAERNELERRLADAPSGGRWRFSNPARCSHCSAEISESILHTTYFLKYPGSVLAEENQELRLKDYLHEA